MSHFAVLVIGDDVEAQLQPYHEYECTGVKDEFVEFVDETAEVLAGWKTDTANCVRLPEGEIVSCYSEEAREYERNNNDALEQIEVPVKEHYADIKEYAEEYHGFEAGGTPDTFGRWTNPDAKWDWWLVGGRWTGFFKVKEGAAHQVGEVGLMTEPAEDGWGDQLRKKDVDIDGMRDVARNHASEQYDQFKAVTAGYELPPFNSWDEVREATDDIEKARAIYTENPFVKAIKDANIGPWFDCALTHFCVRTGGRDAYIQKAVDNCATTFAVVKDGEWYERGDMGWWGMVADEKEDDEWGREFSKLIDGVPDDTLLTVVDCHI